MNRSALTVPLCLAAQLSCRPPSPSIAPDGASPVVREAIQAGDEAWSRAYIAADTAGMRELYTGDVVGMRAGARDVVGREAMIAELAQDFATRTDTVLQIATVIISLEHSGDLAWESGHVTLTKRHRDSLAATPRRTRFKYITFWQRGPEGRWQIRRDLGVPDLLPPS